MRARRGDPPKRAFGLTAAVLAVLVIATLGTWLSLAEEDTAPATTGRATTSEAAATTDPAQEADPVTHVTFGSHTQAGQPCVTCHPDNPKSGSIVCRDCHENTCGKNAKTVADCLECHATGVTEEWAP